MKNTLILKKETVEILEKWHPTMGGNTYVGNTCRFTDKQGCWASLACPPPVLPEMSLNNLNCSAVRPNTYMDCALETTFVGIAIEDRADVWE